jgi:hypothetical protein
MGNVYVVIDDQDSQILDNSAPAEWPCSGDARPNSRRQPDGELASATDSFALRGRGSSKKLDELLDHIKPNTVESVLSC